MFWYFWWSLPIQESARSPPRIAIRAKDAPVSLSLRTYEGFRSPVSGMRSKTNIRIQDAPHSINAENYKDFRVSVPRTWGRGQYIYFLCFHRYRDNRKVLSCGRKFFLPHSTCSFPGLTVHRMTYPYIISSCSECLLTPRLGGKTAVIPSGGTDSASAQRGKSVSCHNFFLSSAMISRKTNFTRIITEENVYHQKRGVLCHNVKDSHAWFILVFCRPWTHMDAEVLRQKLRELRSKACQTLCQRVSSGLRDTTSEGGCFCYVYLK